MPQPRNDTTGERTGQQDSRPAARPFSLRALLRRNPGDFIFENVTRFFAFIVLALVFLMVYEMTVQSLPAMKEFGFGFITSSEWDPVNNLFGALPFIYGTLFSSLGALLLAVPLSVGVAIFLSELAPGWLEQPLSMLVELLAAIPSIVYGLFGIFVMIPWLQSDIQPFLMEEFGWMPLFEGAPYGFGMMAAIMILTIMILPIITSISRDVMRSIPDSQREAAMALGATRWESIRIVLTGSKSGILSAALLGLGRAVGETMAVTMVIGNSADISLSLLDPAHTMASVLANEFAEATSALYVSSLIEIALLLFVITLILNAIARAIVWRLTKRYSPVTA
ncbi:MAG: phosphate ABC transporter permease subunit PstC [Bacteroidota bacterium]|nr:phosphate ABC transporter permease subunit PstC [Bacteroidota bacterium]